LRFDQFAKCATLSKWQAMIDDVRSDPALRLLVIKNFPVWKDPVKPAFKNKDRYN